MFSKSNTFYSIKEYRTFKLRGIFSSEMYMNSIYVLSCINKCEYKFFTKCVLDIHLQLV